MEVKLEPAVEKQSRNDSEITIALHKILERVEKLELGFNVLLASSTNVNQNVIDSEETDVT